MSKGYDGQPQLWLHNAFIGGLWASHRLNGGGTGVSAGTAERVETGIAPLPAGIGIPEQIVSKLFSHGIKTSTIGAAAKKACLLSMRGF